MATVNGTSWSNIFKYATECGPDITSIVAQEHRLPQEGIAEQSRRIFRRGWKRFWTPASLTGKATSGGIVIMVRNHSACNSMPGDESIAPGRVTIAVVEAASLGHVLMGSVYMDCDHPALNREIWRKLRRHLGELGLPFITGCDWQTEAGNMGSLIDDDILGPGGARVNLFTPAEATCFTSRNATCID